MKKSKILIEKDDEISFGYNYILDYLSAKKIADILYEEDGKQIIKELLLQLHIERNANILVFVTHHSRDVRFIEQSIVNTKLALEDILPITLDKKDPFYKSIENLSEDMVKNVLETNKNPKRERDLKLDQQDKTEREKTQGNATDSTIPPEIEDIVVPFKKALRSIEIIGQIIKNRKGSLEIRYLDRMIEEVYTTGFRTISYLYNLLEFSKNAIIDFITNETEITDSRFIIEKKINKFIEVNNFQACVGIFIKITNSIGVKELKPIYNNVASTIGTPAAKLESFGINSSYGLLMKKNYCRYMKNKNNQVALNILRSRVKSYVYNRELDFKTKQRFADILNMKLDIPKRTQL